VLRAAPTVMGLEVAMPVIVITRLRLKDPELFTEFFESVVASWQEAHERLAREGQVTTLTNGTSAHHSRQFPPPVEAS
jgi:hypothetical protein